MLSALILLTFFSSAYAASTTPVNSPSSNVRSLSLTQAIQEALSSNAEVQMARELIESAQDRVWLSRSQTLFHLDFSLDAKKKKDGVLSGAAKFGGESYNQYDAKFKLTQPLFDAGAMWSRISSSKHQKRIAEIGLEKVQRDLMEQVLTAYFTAWVTKEKIDSFSMTLSVERDALKTAEQRVRIGRAQKLDLLQLKTQMALLEAKLAQAQAEFKMAIAELLNLLQSRDDQKIVLVTQLQEKQSQSIEAWIKTLGKGNYRIPEFEEIEEKIQDLDSQNTIQMSKYWPSLDFVADYGRSSNARADLLKDYGTSWSVGLSLNIPILAGLGSFAERSALASETKRLELQRVKTQDDVILVESRALHQLDAARVTIESSQKAFDYADASVKEAKKNYQYSTIDYLQFLLVQQSYLDAKIARDQALLGYIQSVSKYLIATGRNIQDLIPILEGK